MQRKLFVPLLALVWSLLPLPVLAQKTPPGKTAHGPKSAVKVHGYTRKTKSGKVIQVKGYTRNAKPAKTVAVKGYTRTTKSGKVIQVKGHTRRHP